MTRSMAAKNKKKGVRGGEQACIVIRSTYKIGKKKKKYKYAKDNNKWQKIGFGMEGLK